jgi:hypothetical protein
MAGLDSAAKLEPPGGALARARCGLVFERRARRLPAVLRRAALTAASLAMPLGGRAGFARAAV